MKFVQRFFLISSLFILLANSALADHYRPQSACEPGTVIDKEGEGRHLVEISRFSDKCHAAYTALHESSEIIPINLLTGEVGAMIPLEHALKSMIVPSHSPVAYIFPLDANLIIPVNLETGISSTPIAFEGVLQDIVITANGKMAYAIHENSKQITSIDLTAGVTSALITLEKSPLHLALAPDSKTLSVSYKDAPELTTIDIVSLSIKSAIALREAPKALAVTSDRQMLCLGGTYANEMTFYDLETGKQSSLLAIENGDDASKGYQNIHMSPDGNVAYLVQQNSNKITPINIKKHAVDPPIYLHPKRKVFALGPLLLPGDTSTTISSSAAPAVYGEPITLSSTVTSLTDTGIPTGTVTFDDLVLGTIGSGSLDVSGTATFTTSSLAVGSYSFSANYGGDLNYNPSSSAPPQFDQEVNQSLTATSVTAAPNPSSFGNVVILTANVSVVSPGSGVPLGNVTFHDGAATIGVSSLSSGVATFTTSSLTTGAHNITATYEGDSNFLTSTSPVFVETVNKGTTSTSVSTSLTPSPFGNVVTFTATIAVTSGAGTPTGTVTFTDGATILDTQPVSSNIAILSTANLAVGSHTIIATYNGDTNFSASTASGVSQVISQGTTTTTVISSVNPSTYGESVTFTSTTTVATGAGTPTGTVTFYEGATALGTSSLNGAGNATYIISNLSVATHAVTAVYNGNTNFSSSTSLVLSQVVDQATPLANVTSSQSPSNFGALVTFTATISAPTTLGLPSGTVDFYDGATLLGTAGLSGTGPNTATATFSISTLSAVTHSITAVYNGDGNFISVVSPIFSQVVNPVSSTQTVVFSNSPNPSVFGQNVILRATVTGSTASPPFPPSGLITFYDGVIPLGTVSVIPVAGNPNSGTTSLSISTLAIGSHAITAQYLGDVNYPASPLSAPMTQTVKQSSTSGLVTSSVTPSVFGQNVTFTATISTLAPGSGAPSGTVAFYDGATLLGTSTPLVAGIDSSTATFTTNVLSLGSHTITGIYSGDINYTSSSAAMTQVVMQDATTTLITGSTSSPSGFNFGDFVTFTAEVTAAAPGSGVPTGTVRFFDGPTLLGSGTLSAGIATFTTVKLYPTPPSHSITAVYDGDTNFTPSTSPVFSQSISNTLPTTTTLTSSRNSSPDGAAVSYTAQVVAAPGPGMGIPGIPAGTVTFTDTTLGLVLGTATLNSSGVATITESGANLPFVGPAPDIHLIQAVYNGQAAVFDPSTSALFNQYVVPLDTVTQLTATPNASVQGGATLAATVTVVGGIPPVPTVGTVTFYQGTLNLGTVPIQPDGTATLFPNNLHFGLTNIFAVYSGDTLEFAMSTSPLVGLQVQQTDMLQTSTTLTTSLANSIVCQPVTLTAVVSEIQGFYTPTGTVTFFEDGVSLGSAILDNTGTAKLTLTTLAIGIHAITATYNSDSNYAFSFSNTITQTVSANNTALALSVIPNFPSTPYGQNLILSAIVSSTSPYNAIPTGTVTFSNGTSELATVVLDASGEALYQISTLDAGIYPVTATYNPDPCFSTSNATMSHTIAQINPLTTFSVTPNPSVFGELLILNATVTSPLGTPTGTVTFYNGGTALGTVALQAGIASLVIPTPPAGFSILNAHYSGDTNFFAIDTASVQQTINKASTVTCLESYTTNPSVYGELVTLSAKVHSLAEDTPPGLTGSVTFSNGCTLLGTVVLNGCDTAELETSSLDLGSSNNVIATYSGDANFATSSSNVLNRTVTQSSTNTTVTSITSSPNPPLFGTLVTFNVAVTPVNPGTGVPTGSIQGFYGTTSLGSSTLVNGIASFTTSILPVGVQTIIVKYSGDINFTASQTATTETIVAAASTSTMTSSVNPSVFGQPVTFSVSVTSTQGTPTGTVSFLDGTTTLATQTLNSSGTASFTTANLSVATHSIRAIYSGSANLASSSTATLSQVVNKAATTTVLTSSLNPAFYGQVVTLTAKVSPNSPGNGAPSGTITFRNGVTILGTGTLNNSGQATLAISTTLAASVSTYSLTAVYNGDANFNTSTGALSQTINKAPTMITASYSPNPAALGAPVTLNVKISPISPGAGIPSGTVTAAYGSQVVGTGTLLSDGTVTFQTSNLPVGTLGVVVQYLGDANFLPSSIPLTETINAATSTVALTSSVNPSIVGQPVTFSVTVSSTAGALGIPSGVVTFFDGSSVIGTQSLDSTGKTLLTLANLAEGPHAITASYGGDTTNSGATSAAVTQVVNKGATTTTLTSILNPSIFGEPVTLTAVVSANPPGSGLTTGTVTFKNGGVTIPGAVVNLNGLGVASFTVSSLPVGSNSITAVFSGDLNFLTSTSSILSQSVAKTPTITSVTSATNPSTFGSAVAISGTVLPLNNGSTTLPSGTTVTAYYGATAVGSGTLNGSGQYAFSLAGLPAGVLAIEVKYPGDANFSPSTITLTQAVNADVSTTVLTVSPNPSAFGQAITLTSLVTLASTQTPTGTVTCYDGTTAIGTAPVGQPLVLSTLSPGTHPLTAVYSGSASAAGSTSNPVNQVVDQSVTSTTLTSSLNPSAYGDVVTFTAHVAVAGTGSPTGFITFKNGLATLGTGELDSLGNASFATGTLPAGINSITAVYSGDFNFSSSTSTILSQLVNQALASATTTTILTSTPNPSIFGQSVTFFASVLSPNGIPTGTVTYFNGATPLATVPLYDSLALLSISSLPPGNNPITAVYNGDANFNASLPSPIYIQEVDPVAITITTVTTLTSSNNPANYGAPVTFNVQVTSAVTPPTYPSGFVTLYTGSIPLVTLALDATASASYTTSALPAGNLQIVALYSGDHAFSASTDVISQIVNAIATTTTLTSSLNPSAYGDSVRFTATVSSGAGNPTPTGSVSFFDGTLLLQTSLLDNAGVAEFNTASLSIGAHVISAIYNQDSNFATSTDSLVQVVGLGSTSTTILNSTPNPSNLGDSVSFVAGVIATNLPRSGFGFGVDTTATGMVTFYDGNTQLGTGSLIGGLAFFSTSTLTVGVHNITAVYAGDANYSPSTSPVYIQVVVNQATIVQSPRGFCGHQITSKFFSQTDYVNVLTWDPPGTGAEPEFYKIYRDAALTDLIAVIPACHPQVYKDHNRHKGVSYTYYIVAGTQTDTSPATSVIVRSIK